MQNKMQQEQIKVNNNISGWIIALMIPIAILVRAIIPVIPPKMFSVIFFCICMLDRNSLQHQDVWKKGQIHWIWCAISPVYLYLRAKLLKEPLTKFWVSLVFFIISEACLIAALVIASQY